MDWERKFSSIIKDTEANLSRVKNKFNASSGNNVTWAPRNYSTPMKRSTSLLDMQLGSSSRFPSPGLNQSFQAADLYSGANLTAIPQYPSIQTLQEKIEQQNTAIDHLTSLVHRLETDRHNYKEQIRDLRNEVFQLTERASDRRPDPGMERRIEQIRRELLGEVQLLQSQLQISSAKGSNSNISDTQLLSMNRDVLEMKHSFRDELEGFRRDMEILRSRTTKIELELANLLTGKREVERRQDNLDRTLTSLSYAQQSTTVPTSTIALMNTNRQLEKLQINELRASLSALKDKIDVLESQPINSPNTPTFISNTQRPALFSNGLPSVSTPKHKPSNNEELDLSDIDTDSSDFTEFQVDQPDGNKTKPKKDDDLDTINSDDLDIDDLDLSDDELSQNSLRDPVDS